jgi:hypothetical protein
MRQITSVSVLLLACLLAGFACDAKYEDVGGQPEFAPLVGAEFRTLVKLELHGISLSTHPTHEVDYYVVTPPPGIGGREVVERSVVPRGSQVRVSRVLRCSNCLGRSLFDSYEFVHLVIDLDHPRSHSGAEVQLRGVGETTVLIRAGSVAGMSPELFARVDSGEQARQPH